jgi:3-hydroxybutyryl-CoA dehydrogenase
VASAASFVERASEIVRSWGKTPVRSADSPGFIVNRVNRPFTIEALRMVEEGVVTVESVDASMRDAGFPMGPFELMDLAGLDVNLAAARAIWEGLGQPERLRPSPIQEALVEAGHLGRKAGFGFYRYEDGRRGAVAPGFEGSQSRELSAARIRERIETAIRAEARLAVEEEVAAAKDVATALRLGAAYPERLLATL